MSSPQRKDEIMNDCCPVCGEKYVVRCRCPRGHMLCKSGHHWHTCLLHNNVVLGGADHSLPTDRCTCAVGDTESGKITFDWKKEDAVAELEAIKSGQKPIFGLYKDAGGNI